MQNNLLLPWRSARDNVFGVKMNCDCRLSPTASLCQAASSPSPGPPPGSSGLGRALGLGVARTGPCKVYVSYTNIYLYMHIYIYRCICVHICIYIDIIPSNRISFHMILYPMQSYAIL